VSGERWEPAPAVVDLRPDGVDLWKGSLDAAPDALAAFRDTLSEDERARADRFAFPRERERFTASRGLLREVLARYAGATPASLEITADDLGKPRLGGRCGEGRLRFNVSHSADLWLSAVALHREVGVDVEAIRADRTHDRIARRFFSPGEVAALDALPESDRVLAFHACWTRKEAWLKARGFGLTLPLDSFDVTLRPGEEARLLATRLDPADAVRWRLVSLDPAEGFTAALAVGGDPGPIRRFLAAVGA